MIKPRQFIRQRNGNQAPGFDPATAFCEALEVDGAAELWDAAHAAESRLVFKLQRSGIATVVITPDGRHLGTFADPMRAVAHGFGLLDRVAEHQQSTRPARAHRRTTREAPAR